MCILSYDSQEIELTVTLNYRPAQSGAYSWKILQSGVIFYNSLNFLTE